MDRRTFLVTLVFVCGCGQNEAPKTVAASMPPSPSVAPGPKTPRVVMLSFGTREFAAASSSVDSTPASLFRNRLTELGYLDGKTIVVEERYADGDPQRLTQLAQEMVATKPDVIVTIAASATAAVRQATSTIPIVMVHAGNPVGSGLVASLSHPGGNVTGTTSMAPELGVKQIELLRQLMPGLARLGVLANPTNAGTPPLLSDLQEAARRFNISVVVADVTRTEDFDAAFARLRDARLDALFVMMEPLIGVNRIPLLEFAAKNRLPTSYDVGREMVKQGGLISYGPVLKTNYAHAADYVDKILKGTKPGDLPVQQPTQFALVINMNTAKALGVAIPQSMLLRADEVIQ